MRQVNFSDVKALAQGCTASKEQSWDLEYKARPLSVGSVAAGCWNKPEHPVRSLPCSPCPSAADPWEQRWGRGCAYCGAQACGRSQLPAPYGGSAYSVVSGEAQWRRWGRREWLV